MHRELIFALVAFEGTLERAAAQGFPADLTGYSVVADRIEAVAGNGFAFDQHWHESLYFSKAGRIFSKQQVVSGNPNNSGSFAMMSDQTYANQPSFAWDGSGLSRQWTNTSNGVVLTMAIGVSRVGRSFGCTLDLARQGFAGTVVVRRQTCRMFRGNAVAE